MTLTGIKGFGESESIGQAPICLNSRKSGCQWQATSWISMCLESRSLSSTELSCKSATHLHQSFSLRDRVVSVCAPGVKCGTLPHGPGTPSLKTIQLTCAACPYLEL
eukprot:854926-Amphidinium_carterae.1